MRKTKALAYERKVAVFEKYKLKPFSPKTQPYQLINLPHTFLNTLNQHDDVLEKRGPRGTDWQTKALPVDKTLASKPKYLDATQVFVPKLYQQQSDEEEEEHYNRLCRGERLRVRVRGREGDGEREGGEK